MYEYEFSNAIKQLKKLGIPLYDVHLYDGDNVTHNGSDVELLCVVPKKALRKRLRIALLDVWRVRKTLHFERKMVRLYISSKQSDYVINESKSRRRMINSLFNDFYSTYKYSYRMQTILELNKEAILKAMIQPKKRVNQPKDSVKCDCKAARRDDGNCSVLCTVSHQFFWNSERKVCQIKDEFRHLLKAP